MLAANNNKSEAGNVARDQCPVFSRIRLLSDYMGARIVLSSPPIFASGYFQLSPAYSFRDQFVLSPASVDASPVPPFFGYFCIEGIVYKVRNALRGGRGFVPTLRLFCRERKAIRAALRNAANMGETSDLDKLGLELDFWSQ